MRPAPLLAALLSALVAASLAGCGAAAASSGSGSTIAAVGAENEYADVISQIGGRYVRVSAVMTNPNTDPHQFEASPSIARTVSQAKLVVQNGLGYDDFMTKIEAATGGGSRTVIDVQKLRGLPDSTPNPHLWYDPRTMPAVARALVTHLSALQPRHAAYFRANARRFTRSLRPWLTALHHFHARYPTAAVASTEPVADDMLQAAGVPNRTPFSMQATIMNGNDPAPQQVALQDALLSGHRVTAFVYNRQVTDTITQDFLSAARSAQIPVVGVYETMPTPGFDYQSWMMAELDALRRAVTEHTSTETLGR